MSPLLPRTRAAIVASSLFLTACSATSYATDADLEAFALLERGLDRLDQNRREGLVEPLPAPPEQDPAAPEEPIEDLVEPEETLPAESGETEAAEEPERPPGQDQDPAVRPESQPESPFAPERRGGDELFERLPRDSQGALELDLDSVLHVAFTYNRSFTARRESLYQQALGLSLARFDFGPQFDWAVGALADDVENGPESYGANTSFGVSQILPTGGRIAWNSSLSGSRVDTFQGRSFASSSRISLTQPLLRGAGYEVSHEPLVQAERSFVYALRDFELFRQQFAIDRARDYFDLLSQRQVLANDERNYQQARFDRQKSEALLQTGRQPELEVIRARRRELQAENALLDRRANFERSLDQFKITLGLPVQTRLVLADQQPPYDPVDIDSESAVLAAYANRLDLITERQRIADVERALSIARNGLLPDLDLSLDYGFDNAAGDRSGLSPEDWSAGASIAMTIPLQRKPERNRFRSAQIALAQVRRDYQETLDQLAVDVADQIRRLRSNEQQIALQIEQIDDDRRGVAVAEIQFEQGTIENRDLLEARQSLQDAENALVRLYVDHFIGRLQLMRTLGILFIDSRGNWQ